MPKVQRHYCCEAVVKSNIKGFEHVACCKYKKPKWVTGFQLQPVVKTKLQDLQKYRVCDYIWKKVKNNNINPPVVVDPNLPELCLMFFSIKESFETTLKKDKKSDYKLKLQNARTRLLLWMTIVILTMMMIIIRIMSGIVQQMMKWDTIAKRVKYALLKNQIIHNWK